MILHGSAKEKHCRRHWNAPHLLFWIAGLLCAARSPHSFIAADTTSVAYTLARWASTARPAIWRDVMDVTEEDKCGSQTLKLDNLARHWFLP